MQRAGLLVAACIAAEDRRPTDAERVAAQMSRYAQRLVVVPTHLRPSVETYLRSLRLWKRYAELQGRPLSDADLLQVQDVWLADPELPSATGALTPENATETPQLAASLRLLRDGNFTRTDRARALIVATGQERVDALKSSEAVKNPLVLSPGAQLLLLNALLEADGDFLKSLWRVAPPVPNLAFTRPEFTQRLPAACADLISSGRARARTGADQQLLRRLSEWEAAVSQERKSGSEWGGGRPPDQMATLRLEPFVDLGLISRADRFAYRYYLTDSQVAFWRLIADADDVADTARLALVSGWVRAHGLTARRATGEEIWAEMKGAYALLRSSLGFASFVEVALVAVGSLLGGPQPRWFEIQDGIDLLVERRRDSPKEVRLGINRGGELTYMKLSETTRRK